LSLALRGSDSDFKAIIAISVIVIHRHNVNPAFNALCLIASRASAMDYNNLNCYNSIKSGMVAQTKGTGQCTVFKVVSLYKRKMLYG
jgi:hypothetical protein